MSDVMDGRPMVRAGHHLAGHSDDQWRTFEEVRRLCLELADQRTPMGEAATALAQESFVTALQSVLWRPPAEVARPTAGGGRAVP